MSYPFWELQRYAFGKLTFAEAVWDLTVPFLLTLQITTSIS